MAIYNPYTEEELIELLTPDGNEEEWDEETQANWDAKMDALFD